MSTPPLSDAEMIARTPHWTVDYRSRLLDIRRLAVAVITERPFCEDLSGDGQQDQDGTSRSVSNRLCRACRQILTVCREMKGRAEVEGHVASQYIALDYTLAELHVSADAGCHLCSIFEASMLKYIRNSKPSPMETDEEKSEDSWLFFTTLPYKADEERFALQLNMISSYIHSTIGSYIDLFPSNTPFSVSNIKVDRQAVPLAPGTDSEATFEIISSWLRTCRELHDRCNRVRRAEPNVPRRLLHLGETTVRVVENTQQLPYACLSHRWGSQTNVPHRLTEGGQYQPFQINALPKTFRDAIYATKRLGMQHLWIDCFCIVQGSNEDWLQQSAVMAQIYANSVFTIAALAGKDTHAGCFQERNPLALQPLVSDDFVAESHYKDLLWRLEVQGDQPESSPLHTRAWVVQERLSAPRTIFYGSLGVYWECRCMQASESHTKPVEDVTDNTKTMLANLQAAAELPDENSEGPLPVFLLRWQRLLEIYTTCNLTFFSDKLIALSGITKDIEKYSGRRYVQGLWTSDLPTGLLWVHFYRGQSSPREDTTHRVPDSGFSSWSWASMSGRIDYFKYFGRVTWTPQISIEDDTDVVRLRITTWQRGVSINEDNEILLEDDGSKRGDLDQEYVWYSDEREPEQGPMVIILIQRVSITETPLMNAVRSLVVAPVARNVYRRLGMSMIRFNDLRDDPYPSGEPVSGDHDIVLI